MQQRLDMGRRIAEVEGALAAARVEADAARRDTAARMQRVIELQAEIGVLKQSLEQQTRQTAATVQEHQRTAAQARIRTFFNFSCPLKLYIRKQATEQHSRQAATTVHEHQRTAAQARDVMGRPGTRAAANVPAVSCACVSARVWRHAQQLVLCPVPPTLRCSLAQATLDKERAAARLDELMRTTNVQASSIAESQAAAARAEAEAAKLREDLATEMRMRSAVRALPPAGVLR